MASNFSKLQEACDGKSAGQGGLNVPELKNALIQLMPERETEIRKAKRPELEEICKEITTITTKVVKKVIPKKMVKKMVKKVPIVKKVPMVKKVPIAKKTTPRESPKTKIKPMWICNDKNKPYMTCEEIDISRIPEKKLLDMTLYSSEKKCMLGCQRYGSNEFLSHVEKGWPYTGKSYRCDHDDLPLPSCKEVNFNSLSEEEKKNISIYPTEEICKKSCTYLFDKDHDSIEDPPELDIDWLRKHNATLFYRAINHFEVDQYKKDNLGKGTVTLTLQDIPVQTWVKAGSRITKYAPQYMSLSLDSNKTINKYSLQLDKEPSKRLAVRPAVELDIDKLIEYTTQKGGTVRFPKKSDLDFKIGSGVTQTIVKIHPKDVIIIPIFDNKWLNFLMTGTFNYTKPNKNWKQEKTMPFDVRSSTGWAARNYALKDQEVLVVAKDIPTSALKLLTGKI